MSEAQSTSSRPAPVGVQEISLNRIRESKGNPRRFFDEAKLQELADNIKVHGVLQPVLVRPLPGGPEGTCELVAGARRFRASKLAGKQTIPATVRELNDAECREIQLIENLQRADIHELDEALGYRALRDLNPELYTVETIATQIGKTGKYVYGRMKLGDLIPAVQTAFYEGRLTVAHALEIARLQPRDQERALEECFPGHRSVASILKDRKAEAVSVRGLREWIERKIHLDLKNAPFDAGDADLLPTAGPCTACPKRTGNNPLLFPEIRNKSLCTDPACYKAKVRAFVQLRVAPLAEQGRKPLQVSEVPYWQAHIKAANTLYEGQYRRAEREGECADTQVAVVVDGRKAGTVLHICTSEKCKIHGRTSRYEVSPQEREQRRKTALAARIQKEARLRVLQAVRKELPGALSRPDFEMVALDYFRRLGHDNHHRLFQVYGWEEKKTKSSWGGISVDHEKLAQYQIRSMTIADVNCFMVTCALVSDLYYAGFGGDEVLSKDSNLAQAASRYEVSATKIAATVREELSAKRKATKPGPRGSKRARQPAGS
ncbi:MAG: ParB/RepB/Spo0J family partition protein [Acidobacteria bacterium]|nr:ParB/RepB/Spo0J family partition protein [Acidobacteriota bacterium]MBI3663609.1 ParB/RepB/Spo0J family partition protein [Acidobacteriota bacterium]